MSYRKCPNCGDDLQYDEVDTGVGFMSSPAWCPNQDCCYSEDTCGLCEPDGRAPTNEVPKLEDLPDSRFDLSDENYPS